MAIILILGLLLAVASAVHEVPMRHHKRTPRESKMLLEYMNRGPFATRINELLSKIFPSELVPNIYAYPEVKIINYLDAQYYGYHLNYVVKYKSVLLPKVSMSSLTQDLQTCVFPPKSADSPLPATSINTLTQLKVLLTLRMVAISTLPTVQVLSLVSWAKTPLG